MKYTSKKHNKKSKFGNNDSNKKSTKKSKKIKKLYLKKIISDEDIEKKEGDFFNSKKFKYKINYDCDVYGIDENRKQKILGRFRKNVISKTLTQSVIDNLKEAAMKKHANRGAAAGPLTKKTIPSYVDLNKIKTKNKFRFNGYYSSKDGKFKNSSLTNVTNSNIIGYFDKPDRNPGASKVPCRLTAFNVQHKDKFKNVSPFLKKCDKLFKKLMPKEHLKQYKRAHNTNFVIQGTSFSTITINHNWRTALHKDSGDFKDGFGNLIVCEDIKNRNEKKYEGGCTGFPQYGVCFDVRDGDFLAMDVHEWHCNTELKPLKKNYTRLSVVCYLREKMIRCKGLKVEENFMKK